MANYTNGGYFPFTATGGGCARAPSAIFNGAGSANATTPITDPGFLCWGTTAPTASLVNVPGSGAQQATGAGSIATTCASNSPVSGEVTVTAHVAVAHGLSPGMTYPMSGFSTTAFNTTYTALQGTNSTTLVGEAAIGSPSGTCPTLSGEGFALQGTGGAISFPVASATTPFSPGGTGITGGISRHFCGIVGEYGADSSFPGAQFASFVDDKGDPLPGAPALVPWLNQGTANFTGFTLANTQSPSSPALNITAMNSYSIIGATYSGGQVTFCDIGQSGVYRWLKSS